VNEFVLKLDSPYAVPGIANYLLPSFPPPPDFPIAVDMAGAVVCRYADPSWNLSWLAGKPVRLDFGVAPRRRDSLRLSSGNSELLKQVMIYYMYGERNLVTADTLSFYIASLRPLFKLCNDNGILVSDLARYPKVVAKVSGVVHKSKLGVVMSMLFELYNAREFLQFEILPPERLQMIIKSAPETTKRQHPYIPPRLWLYQMKRCREMLEEFNRRCDDFEAIYHHCLDVYQRKHGSLAAFYELPPGPRMSAFQTNAAAGLGSFADTARAFGVAEVIEKWVVDVGSTLDEGSGVRLLSKYFGAVQFVGSVYLASFSGMRASEVARLRSDCLVVDHDERVGDVYLLQGDTRKTVDDDNAIWITSPTAKIAVEAMSSVARMRMTTALEDPRFEVAQALVENPYLITRTYEPWGVLRVNDIGLGEEVRKALSFREWRMRCPRLFDPKEILITEEDLQAARLVTPSLDMDRYAVGKPWNFTFHQLRRTLNVNATHSGIVSLPSLQYEMKHQTPTMSLYYGQGFSRLRLNRAMTTEFIETMFQALATRASSLLGDEFASPLGEKHKSRMVEFISQRTANQLLSMAKKGQISIRETVLGVCLNRDYCPYGGIDHLSECTRCDKALISKAKRDQIERVGRLIAQAIVDVDSVDSLLRECFDAQEVAVKEALNVIDAD